MSEKEEGCGREIVKFSSISNVLDCRVLLGHLSYRVWFPYLVSCTSHRLNWVSINLARAWACVQIAEVGYSRELRISKTVLIWIQISPFCPQICTADQVGRVCMKRGWGRHGLRVFWLQNFELFSLGRMGAGQRVGSVLSLCVADLNSQTYGRTPNRPCGEAGASPIDAVFKTVKGVQSTFSQYSTDSA
jgi:hypothetical protein